MSFGFAPSISFSPFGFDHGFFDESAFDSFFNMPARHYFARNGLHPRHFRGEACAPLSGRCVPWRRAARPTPSIFDLISFGSDFDRFWETLDREEEVPKIESKEKLSSSSPALTSAASSSSSHASNSSSEVSNKASSEVATTSAAPLEKKSVLGEVDVKHDSSATHYDVHLPGLSLGDIKLDFDFKRHALYVKAEKKIEESKEDKHGKRSFVRHVSVSRTLPLPDGVKPDDVKADFVDNVLSISVAHKAIEAPADAPTSTSLPISDASGADSTSPKQDEVTTTPVEDSAPVLEASSSSESAVSESAPVPSSEPETSAADEISASTSSSATENDENSATVEDAE